MFFRTNTSCKSSEIGGIKGCDIGPNRLARTDGKAYNWFHELLVKESI